MMDPFIELKTFIGGVLLYSLILIAFGFWQGWKWRDESQTLWTEEELEKKLKSND